MDRVGPFNTTTLVPSYGSTAYAAWQNANLGGGVEGSVPSVEAWTHAIEEIAYCIEQSGQTPNSANLHQLWQAIKNSFKTQKALFNVQTVNTTTRTTVSGSGANVYTTALSGTITKSSATSKLVVWLTNPIYYTTTGPTAIRLIVDAGTAFGLTSPATPGQSYGQTALNAIFSGLPAGSLNWTLAYARGDATAWSSTCNPNSTDQSYYPASSTTGIVYGEIEP